MKRYYVFERIEDGVATVVGDCGEVINIAPDKLSALSIGDVFLAKYTDGVFSDIEPDVKETERRKAHARSILDKFKNKKHN